jgi:hypothetical protein
MTGDPPAIPPPRAAIERRVKITLGSRRYELTISARAEEVKPEPAEVIEMPKRP